MDRNEIWREIKGYEGLYQISNLGRIKNMIFNRINEDYCKFNGYRTTALTDKNGNLKNVSIHRLVAEIFIPNPENKPCVNHKNFIQNDNKTDNLEWVTHSENTKHWWDNVESKRYEKNDRKYHPLRNYFPKKG